MMLLTRQIVTNRLVDGYKRGGLAQDSGIRPIQEWEKRFNKLRNYLVSLPDNPDPEVVQGFLDSEMMPDLGSTHVPVCDECRQSKDQVVEIGLEDSEFQNRNCLCGDCLIKALNLHEENC